MCYPSDPRNGNFLPNWMLWLLLETEEYVRRHSGDREMAELAEKHLLDALHYFEGFENGLGLLEKLEAWVFVEWSKANELVQDVNAPSNMLYAAALEAVARLYDRPALAEEAAAGTAYPAGRVFRRHALARPGFAAGGRRADRNGGMRGALPVLCVFLRSVHPG